MPKRIQVLGLPKGAVDKNNRQIQFDLAIADGTTLEFLATQDIAEQIIAALAPMAKALRHAGPQTVAAETIAEYTIQRDVMGGPILVRLVTPEGVPYSFQIPLSAANDIADRLKTESAKPPREGGTA